MTKIFVYGTLKKGGRLQTGLETKVTKDTLKGTMYSLRAFPGIKLEGDSKVYGEVHEVDEKYLPLYDRIESEGWLYSRKEVVTESGTVCWVYEIIQDLPEELIIEEGVWQI